MMPLVLPAACVLVVLSGLWIALLLWRLTSPGSTHSAHSDWSEINLKTYRPLERLLDPREIEFVQRTVSGRRARRLRRERRRIFRRYLCEMLRDYNLIQRSLHSLLIASHQDRAELSALLLRQRCTLYRNLLALEFRLTLHACGFEPIKNFRMIEPFEALLGQLRELTCGNGISLEAR